MRKLTVIIYLLFVLTACTNRNSQLVVENDYEKDTSAVILNVNKHQHLLTKFTATTRNDSLQLLFTESMGFDLIIIKEKGIINCELLQNWSVTDSSFIRPVFKTLHQHVSFNKDAYQKGDKLQGNMRLLIVGYYQWPETYIDTIIVNGWVKTTVH